MISFDPFGDEVYMKFIPDFNKEAPVAYFTHAAIQQIDQHYSYLVGHFTNITHCDWRYKPEKARFPGYGAILLKREEYVVNLKNSDGSWQKIAIQASPLDKWLLDMADREVPLLKGQFQGFINFSDTTLDALSNKITNDPNSTGLMQILPVATGKNLDFPQCPFKPSGGANSSGMKYNNHTKTGGFSSQQSSTKKAPLDWQSTYYLSMDAFDMADKAWAKINEAQSQGFDKSGDETRKLALYLAVLIDRFNSR